MELNAPIPFDFHEYVSERESEPIEDGLRLYFLRKGANQKRLVLQMTWEDLETIEKFTIFQGTEYIYEIHLKGKTIKLEGKEIMDYNIFRMKFFEVFGTMLPTYRGIASDWATLVTKWRINYGEVQMVEESSEFEDAKQLIIDYINNSTIADDYIIKEGIITLRDECIYIPTKIIKKILKRESIIISMRKLAYVFDDYLMSGSIPLKVENRSERFWKFKVNKFNIDKKKLLEVQVKDE